VELLESGQQLKIDLTQRVQETAAGIADSVGLGEASARDLKTVDILGQDTATNSIKLYVDRFRHTARASTGSTQEAR
jgi:dTDP-glucose pyrophosphorylase